MRSLSSYDHIISGKMRFSLSILSILSAAGLASSSGIPVVGELAKLAKLCLDGGPNVYVGVLYDRGTTVTYSFDQCYPYTLSDGELAEMAFFCQSVTCYSNPYLDCEGGSDLPTGVPVPAGTTLVNAADFVQLLGQGATCEENGIPV